MSKFSKIVRLKGNIEAINHGGVVYTEDRSNLPKLCEIHLDHVKPLAEANMIEPYADTWELAKKRFDAEKEADRAAVEARRKAEEALARGQGNK